MAKKQHNVKLDYKHGVIDVKKIDPSPFQVRKYFELKTIPAQIVIASDLQARRISATENLQREDLSAIETIEAVVKIVDAELTQDKEYASMGKKPADRVKVLLGKLDTMRRGKVRGFNVTKDIRRASRKFAGRVAKIFKSLPKSLEWRLFYRHDLPILIDFCEEVREASLQNRLNRSQTRALEKLRSASKQEFERVAAHAQRPPNSETGPVGRDSSQIELRDLSGREIEEIADKAAKKESLKESGTGSFARPAVINCRTGSRTFSEMASGTIRSLRFSIDPEKHESNINMTCRAGIIFAWVTKLCMSTLARRKPSLSFSGTGASTMTR